MRVAVIVPKHRLWQWHRALLASLASWAQVEVFVDDHAPPYPALLRWWLRLERYAFATGSMAWPALPDPGWQANTALRSEEFDRVVNLAEHPIGPPDALDVRYDGVADSRVLFKLLLARQTPVVSVGVRGAATPIETSRPAIQDKLLLTRGLQLVFARGLSLVGRALAGATRAPRAPDDSPVPNETPPSLGASATLGFIAGMAADKASTALLRPARRCGHWAVALRRAGGPFRIVPDQGRCYYADPFLFAHEGRIFLFVEEVSYAIGKGVISVAEIVGDRLVAPPVPVLERPYHMSYPFVMADGDAVYMLPESGANASLDLYRAVEFPWRWEHDQVLMEGCVLADATLLYHAGLWWLFAAVAEHGGAGHDEMCLFHSKSLRGPWIPHGGNPVKSDCRSARPAGRIVQAGGRLFRPAQDCGKSYGGGLVWLEITQLTPDEFRETEVVRWDGRATLGADGLHSVDHCGPLEVVDFKRNVGRGIFRRSPDLLTLPLGSELDRTGESLAAYLEHRAAAPVA